MGARCNLDLSAPHLRAMEWSSPQRCLSCTPPTQRQQVCGPATMQQRGSLRTHAPHGACAAGCLSRATGQGGGCPCVGWGAGVESVACVLKAWRLSSVHACSLGAIAAMAGLQTHLAVLTSITNLAMPWCASTMSSSPF